MWQRFTDKSREVVFAAQREAQKRNTSYVNSEHLLLGLLADEGNVACRILQRMNISLEALRVAVEKQASVAPQTIREAVEKQTGMDKTTSFDAKADMQLTPRAKRIVDLSYDEARQLSNKYIGTEHLLLGLIREGEGLAGRSGATARGTGADAARSDGAARQRFRGVSACFHFAHFSPCRAVTAGCCRALPYRSDNRRAIHNLRGGNSVQHRI